MLGGSIWTGFGVREGSGLGRLCEEMEVGRVVAIAVA